MTLPLSVISLLPSLLREKVGYSTSRSISGLIILFTIFRPAIFLSTLRSERYRAPRKTRYKTAG